jgi:ADP-heptose:LPS heptosyltransferase
LALAPEATRVKKFIFKCNLSLGDIVLLTAAVRELHSSYPGLFATDVRTSFRELWQNNPFLTPLDEYDPEVKILECQDLLLERSRESACHALHGFLEFLNRRLGFRLKPTAFRGDIYLSRAEKAAASPLRQMVGQEIPFWLIAAGGKLDYTIKWWDARRYQEVVDAFRGRIQFVQVGQAGHYHPPLRGVIDLRGRTGVRELVRLVYHAQGVLCGVTGLMHLASAVPLRDRQLGLRPCVVIAGGREPAHWEAYPAHQFMHTIGALPCCATDGCWKSRTVALGDGDDKDRPEELCVDVRGGLPRCMDLITSGEVARRIETYFEGGAVRFLAAHEARGAARAVALTAAQPEPEAPLNACTARPASDRFIAALPDYPLARRGRNQSPRGIPSSGNQQGPSPAAPKSGPPRRRALVRKRFVCLGEKSSPMASVSTDGNSGFRGRGIVICGGGVRMFTNAWVCIRLLRHLGCTLPIELWHLGEAELDEPMRALVRPLGVQCVDALALTRQHPARQLHGWALKSYALLHSSFAEILLLDADNVPAVNPEFLFDSPEYRQAGAVLWPDQEPLASNDRAWAMFGVPYRDEPAVESGQLLVNKAACWRALALARWYNDHADFYYQYVHGDKETFHFAFRKVQAPYAMPTRGIKMLRGAMCQHDFAGRRLFQHRNMDKWTLFPSNRRIPGFQHERACKQFLRELAGKWDARLSRFGGAGLQSGEPQPRTGGPAREVSIAAVMISCAVRERLRARTLADLARTDWGAGSVRLILDEQRFRYKVENIAHTGWRALKAGLETGADYVLLLEDDLAFNRRLRENLRLWPLLQQGRLAVLGLYNPGLPELAWDLAHQAVLVDPNRVFASQAMLVSRPGVARLLEHWFKAPPPLDLKLAWLAANLGQPVAYHCPSLVQHLGRKSVWGGFFHQARDFSRSWQAVRP